MNYDKAKEALNNLFRVGYITEEDGEALSELVALFAPYGGCPPEEAAKRKLQKLHCQNCKEVWTGMATPAPANLWVQGAIRMSVCPRCFNNQTVFLGAGPEDKSKVAKP